MDMTGGKIYEEQRGIKTFGGDPTRVVPNGGDSWDEAINIALDNHRRLMGTRMMSQHQQKQSQSFVETYISSDLFIPSVQVATDPQYQIKDEMLDVFHIFPWFLHLSRKREPVREYLSITRGENIEKITQAINSFRTQPLDEADVQRLKEYYHQMAGPPQRPLWSIVEMKRTLDQKGLRSLTKGSFYFFVLCVSFLILPLNLHNLRSSV
jgi:hypothetical protein